MLLITGITGRTGRYLIEQLVKNKYSENIRCIVRLTSDTSLLDNSGLNVEKVYGDLNNQEFLNGCMKNVDIVIHIANINYSLNVIRAAGINRVHRAICVHTTGVFSKYKAASEEYKAIEEKFQELITENETKATILRPTMIFGYLSDKNMSKFIRMVDRIRIFPVINHGKGLIQPVNARDLGKAYYNVMMMAEDNVKYSYELSGDKPIMLLDALKLISKALGKRTIFISIPICLGVFLAQIVKIISIGKIDYVEKVQRMGENRNFSHEDATKDFGYDPEPFEIGIKKEVIEYLRKCEN